MCKVLAFGRELDIDTADGRDAFIKGIQSYSLTIDSGRADLLFISVKGRSKQPQTPKKRR